MRVARRTFVILPCELLGQKSSVRHHCARPEVVPVMLLVFWLGDQVVDHVSNLLRQGLEEAIGAVGRKNRIGLLAWSVWRSSTTAVMTAAQHGLVAAEWVTLCARGRKCCVGECMCKGEGGRESLVGVHHLYVTHTSKRHGKEGRAGGSGVRKGSSIGSEQTMSDGLTHLLDCRCTGLFNWGTTRPTR
jgi:hypothetical protein